MLSFEILRHFGKSPGNRLTVSSLGLVVALGQKAVFLAHLYRDKEYICGFASREHLGQPLAVRPAFEVPHVTAFGNVTFHCLYFT
jgi:hypothetical protein